VLESKADMQKRGYASPDDGDALALTFAQPVAPVEVEEEEFGGLRRYVGTARPFVQLADRASMNVLTDCQTWITSYARNCGADKLSEVGHDIEDSEPARSAI
jgi:hypothetical protein